MLPSLPEWVTLVVCCKNPGAIAKAKPDLCRRQHAPGPMDVYLGKRFLPNLSNIFLCQEHLQKFTIYLLSALWTACANTIHGKFFYDLGFLVMVLKAAVKICFLSSLHSEACIFYLKMFLEL